VCVRARARVCARVRVCVCVRARACARAPLTSIQSGGEEQVEL